MKINFNYLIIFALMAFLLPSCEKDRPVDSDKYAQTELRAAGNDILCCTDAPLSNPNVDCGYDASLCYTLVDSTITGFLVTPQRSDKNGCVPEGYCWTALSHHNVEYWYDYSSGIYYLDDGTDNCGGWTYGIKTTTKTTGMLDNISMAFPYTNWNTGLPETQYCDLYFNYHPIPDQRLGEYSRSYWRHGVDSCDADIIDLYLEGRFRLRAWQLIAADVDANGTVDSLDSEMIRQLAGVTALDKFPVSSVTGCIGYGKTPYIYINQKAYEYAATVWEPADDHMSLTRLAYINVDLPKRFKDPVTSCKEPNPWGAFNAVPYNYGLGKQVYAIKRGDVNSSHDPALDIIKIIGG